MEMTQKQLRRESTERTQLMPISPAVDIREDAEGILLQADLPGVTRENLSINVEGDTLTIEGAVTLGESSALKSLYAEVRVAQYKRSFVLSRDLDHENVSAALKDGVLALRIPKREAAKPRRIEVRVG